MTIRITFILLSLAVAAGLSRAGTLVTRDGKTIVGELSLADDQVVVTPKGGAAQRIAIKEIARASFAEPAGAAVTYGKPRADKRTDGPLNVFVEYFADLSMTDRRLARYEGTLSTFWSAKTLPDPTIPPRCYVRYTTRVASKATQDYALAVEGYGPLRLYVDGQLKIDRWSTATRDTNKGNATIKLTAAKPVLLKWEVGSKETQYLSKVNWSGRGANGAIPADAMMLPDDATPAPVVTASVVGDASHFRSPASIGFDAKVEEQGGRKVAKVELLSAAAELSEATMPPYHFDWRNPPADVYKIRVRATDDRGVSGYSDVIDLSVGDAGDGGSLPAPWGTQSLAGKKETRIAGSASFAAGTFKITKAGGQLSENDDSSQFVYQPVYGDFEIVARLDALVPNENQVGPLAGIMVRENMTSLDRYAAVVIGPQSTAFVRRPQYWGNATSTERAEPPQAWLKLVRHGTHVRAYTSGDGKIWALLGLDKIELPERAFVGICAMSRSKETPAVATFDHVAVRVGPPALTHGVEGVLFRSGTFLAAEVNGMKEGSITYTRSGKRVTTPNADVARLVYKPVPAELGENVPADRTGVLLGSGDFIEGELKEISHHAIVSSVLFGRRTIPINGDVLAIYVRDADTVGAANVVTVKDGSVYQAKTVRVSATGIAFEDPVAGPVELAAKDVAELKVR